MAREGGCARGWSRSVGRGGASPHLQVHVSVDGDEVALVLHAPFELDEHGLSGEIIEEGLRVDGLHGRDRSTRKRRASCDATLEERE